MSFDLVLGIFAIAFGVFTGVARVLKLNVFAKAEPMQARVGERAGTAVHLVAYTILPIVLGGSLIFLNLTIG